MGKVLRCADIQPGCAFVARGETEEEILKQAAQHTKQAHGIEVNPAVADAVRKAIRSE